MNPAAPAPAPAPTATSSQFDPSSSPLHPPSVMHNARVLSSLATLAACASGLVAGILGLTNFYGFALYILTALSSAATVAVVKCNLDIGKYVPQAHGVNVGAGPVSGGGGGVVLWKGWWALAGLGQENLLGFLLFWIGSYALIHVYD